MTDNILHRLALQRRSCGSEQAAEALSLEVFITDRFSPSTPAVAAVPEVAGV